MSTHELWTSRDCFSNVPLWLLLSDNSSKLFDLQVNSVFLCVKRGLGFFNPSLRIFLGDPQRNPVHNVLAGLHNFEVLFEAWF